jgi:phosphoribosyl-AMP cyclohydrolase
MSIEDAVIATLDFQKLPTLGQSGQQVLPVVVQDADTRDVLFVAYANEHALAESHRTGRAVFWSTSRNELWRKGDGSGDVLELVDVRVNCEQNSLLYAVRRRGPGACHTRDASGRRRVSCYYRALRADDTLEFVDADRPR